MSMLRAGHTIRIAAREKKRQEKARDAWREIGSDLG
jgi:hypothetical protein